MNIVYSPRALHDLQSIANYLNIHNPVASRRIIATIKSNVETLIYFPEMGRLVDNAGHRNIIIHKTPYIIYYKVFDDEILINHIRHASRIPLDPTIDLL